MLLFAAIPAVIIKIVMAMVMLVVRLVIEQILQEIIEEVSGNEDFFDELGIDEFWRRHNWWIQDEVETMVEEGATEEEIVAFASEQSEAMASSITKTWVAEPGGSLSGTCRLCRDLDGETVNIRDSFAIGTYGPVITPPRHPNCQCRINVSF